MSAKVYLNTAILHTDTNKHTYTDTDGALITRESTEAGYSKRGWTLLTPVIVSGFALTPEGQCSITLEKPMRQKCEISGDRLTRCVN